MRFPDLDSRFLQMLGGREGPMRFPGMLALRVMVWVWVQRLCLASWEYIWEIESEYGRPAEQGC